MLAVKRRIPRRKARPLLYGFPGQYGLGSYGARSRQHPGGVWVSVVQVALANSAFVLARLVLDVPIGILMDRVDQRWLRLVGALALAGGSAMCALAPGFESILLGRLLNGLGAAIIQSPIWFGFRD